MLELQYKEEEYMLNTIEMVMFLIIKIAFGVLFAPVYILFTLVKLSPVAVDEMFFLENRKLDKILSVITTLAALYVFIAKTIPLLHVCQ